MNPRVLIIGGSDSGGGAGIQADLKTVSALGAYGMTAVTALTAQNTTGVLETLEVAPSFVARQIDACAGDIGCDSVKTGMLVSAEVIEVVADRIGAHGLRNLVVDPVLVAKGGARLLRADAVEALRTRLVPLATVVTPNLPEASALVGREIRTRSAMREAARALYDLGARHVVVKGGHLEGDAVDVFFDGGSYEELSTTRIATPHTHGTGCIFASAIAAGLSRGESVYSSVVTAKRFVTRAIRGGLALGHGQGPADPLAGCGRAARTD